MTSPRLSYRFGPLERRGILGPVRAGQATVLAAGALTAIGVLDQAPSAGGALAATLVFAGAIALALAPAGGRTAEEWAPIVASFLARRLRRRAYFHSRAPARGSFAGGLGKREPVLEPPLADPPPSMRDARIVEASYRDRSVGVISVQRGRRLTAVLACRVVAFSLLDPEAQERRLGRWGLVLSGAAGTPVRRIQWIERTAPAQGDELARWVGAERDPAVPLRGTAMIESYLELIGTTASVTQEHEILVAVQVDARQVRDRGSDATTRA